MVITKENVLFKARSQFQKNIQLHWITSLFQKSSWIKITASLYLMN